MGDSFLPCPQIFSTNLETKLLGTAIQIDRLFAFFYSLPQCCPSLSSCCKKTKEVEEEPPFPPIRSLKKISFPLPTETFMKGSGEFLEHLASSLPQDQFSINQVAYSISERNRSFTFFPLNGLYFSRNCLTLIHSHRVTHFCLKPYSLKI